MSEGSRIWVGHVPIDLVNAKGALDAIEARIRSGLGGTVFTPNVDHVVRAARDASFRASYSRTAISLADGMPVVWTARWSGAPGLTRTAGSDLFVPLLERANACGFSLYVIGGREGASAKLEQRIATEFPRIRFFGAGPRTRVLAADPTLLEGEAARIEREKPDLVLVCLGAPLQETWADEVSGRLKPSLLVGLGSAMDVAVGMQGRAPKWMQHAGLEWFYRLAKEPRRLWRRYLVEDAAFLPIGLRTIARHQSSRLAGPRGQR